MARAAPAPSSSGWTAWKASEETPYPATSATMSAPRSMACSKLSITSTAAPSAGTNPSRFASKGLLAFSGGSFSVLSARMTLKPPSPSALMPASQPPPRITSAAPLRITSAGLAMAWLPAAQAVMIVEV